jgi:endonuclease YncB( thermonuclease family)
LRIVVAVLAVLIAACAAGDGITASLPAQDPASSTGGELPVTDVDAIVTRVADGDSFRARSEAGEIEVRLLGINSPEEDECHGAEAMTALDDLIAGRNISLATEPELDQFDRVLARAVVDEIYVNVAMVLDTASSAGPAPTGICSWKRKAKPVPGNWECGPMMYVERWDRRRPWKSRRSTTTPRGATKPSP